jgi:hypothetical protein
MLRDAKSLDVIETLLLALADCEQRVAWIDGENASSTDGRSRSLPAMSGRLEHIRIATGRGDNSKNIRLPWASRDVLLEQLRRAEGADGITKAFEDVGTSRPVTLTIEQKAVLFRVLEDWALTSSFDRMPAGLFGLRNALSDDLHDAEQRAL